jgi:hypothetical protein
MKRLWMMMLCALCLLMSSNTAAQTNDSDYELTKAAQLPANLLVAKEDRPTLEKVWRRSATLRTQIARIAQADWLTVKLVFNSKGYAPGCHCLALTAMHRQKQLAVVRIFAPGDYVELLGHEFEHVLEQIEGIHLPSLVAAKSEQAWLNDADVFETKRAVQAGRRVKAEYHRARRNGPLPQ